MKQVQKLGFLGKKKEERRKLLLGRQLTVFSVENWVFSVFSVQFFSLFFIWNNFPSSVDQHSLSWRNVTPENTDENFGVLVYFSVSLQSYSPAALCPAQADQLPYFLLKIPSPGAFIGWSYCLLTKQERTNSSSKEGKECVWGYRLAGNPKNCLSSLVTAAELQSQVH